VVVVESKNNSCSKYFGHGEGVDVDGAEESEGRRVSMLSFVDAEESEEEELPSSAVVKGIAGGRGGAPLFCFMVGRARSRSDILSDILIQMFCFVFRKLLVLEVKVEV
jgi:hypothetical protein